jgi:hypothetical protein
MEGETRLRLDLRRPKGREVSQDGFEPLQLGLAIRKTIIKRTVARTECEAKKGQGEPEGSPCPWK